MTTWMDCLSDSLDGLQDKDRQSAKTRDNSYNSSCRYAQPSCSPEDGKLYDQESYARTDDPQPEGLTGPTACGSCGEISDAASKSATSCDTLTADGDTREDSQAEPYGSAITRNETRSTDALDSSANHYATRQAKNVDDATREGAYVSTTVYLL